MTIGWNLGDLSGKSDEEIRELYKNKYKNLRSLNQVLRFKNEIKINDYVISAKGSTRTYFIGKIVSDHKRVQTITQRDSTGDNYFDIRDVVWLCEVQRDSLSKLTQKNIGFNATVFNIEENAKNEVLNFCRDNMDAIDASDFKAPSGFEKSGGSYFKNGNFEIQ